MFRLLCSCALIVLASATAFAADDTPKRVALFLADRSSPEETCQFHDVERTLRDLRFVTKTVADDDPTSALAEFGTQTEHAEAAMLFTCNPNDRRALPALMRAGKLNFLFLIETQSAPRGTAISDVIKTKRDNLVIVHARLGTADNRDIFMKTLVRKLRRPYSQPYEILSRTVVSSYYRSRGSMMTELRGQISSGYVLATPPTDKILDAWSRVQRSKDRAALEEFISKFPTTLFADLARSRLEKLP